MLCLDPKYFFSIQAIAKMSSSLMIVTDGPLYLSTYFVVSKHFKTYLFVYYHVLTHSISL